MALFLNTYCPPRQHNVPSGPGDIITPSFQEYFAIAAQYSNIQNFIFLGKVKVLKAAYGALGHHQTTKHVFFLENDDPADILYAKKRATSESSLVVAIGNDDNDDEATLRSLIAFNEYKKLIISGKNTALKKFQEVKELAYAPYEKTAFESTSTGVILPLVLLYINAQEFYEGIQHMRAVCNPQRRDNPAVDLVVCTRKKNPVVTFFGKKLHGFQEWVQGILQVTGDEKVFVPIIAQSDEDIRLDIPYEYRSIPLQEGTLGMYEGASLHQERISAFERECEKSRQNNVPLCTLTIDKINPYAIGELIGFFEYVDFYAKTLKKE